MVMQSDVVMYFNTHNHTYVYIYIYTFERRCKFFDFSSIKDVACSTFSFL